MVSSKLQHFLRHANPSSCRRKFKIPKYPQIVLIFHVNFFFSEIGLYKINLFPGTITDTNIDIGSAASSCATPTVPTVTSATGTMPVISHQHQSSLITSSLASNIGVSDVSSSLSGLFFPCMLVLVLFYQLGRYLQKFFKIGPSQFLWFLTIWSKFHFQNDS